MASIYKRGGRRNRYGRYRISYFDEHGKRQDVTAGTSDHDVAEQIAGKIESEVAMKRRGIITPDEAKYAEHYRRPLMEHVEDYLAAARHDQESPVHVSNKRAQLTKMMTATGFARLPDIDGNKVEPYLQGLKGQPGKNGKGKSNRTVNQHRNTAVAFCEWCVEKKRMPENPLAGLPKLSEELDRRRIAKPMTDDEIHRLLGVSGKRQDFYLVWAHTGLRIGTLKKLLWADVHLEVAMLRIPAKSNKSGKEKIKPLHPEAVEALSRLRGNAKAKDLVFGTVPRLKTFYRDLERAGIDRMDDEGRQLYLHCSRHTIGTRLALSGVPLSVTQRLMDHSDPRLTAKHYTVVGMDDMRKALANIPRLLPCSDTVTLQHNRQQSCGLTGQIGASAGKIGADTEIQEATACSDQQPRYNPPLGNAGQIEAMPDNENCDKPRIDNNLRAIGAVG